MVLVSCKYCGKMHPAGYICERKPVHKTKYKPEYNKYKKRLLDNGGGDAIRFRSKAVWQRKAAEIQSRDHYCCRVCADSQQMDVNSYITTGLSVHHIIPIKDAWDKRLDNDNLITLCSKHHYMADHGYYAVDYLRRLAATDFLASPGIKFYNFQ